MVSESMSAFFSVMWNWLDLLGSFGLLIHCIGFILRDTEDDESLSKFYAVYDVFTLIASLCLLLRGVSRISPFSTQIRLLLGIFI